MDAEDRKQLDRLTERALTRADEEAQQGINQIYAEHGAKGTLGSGSTIKAGVRLMGEIGGRRLHEMLDDFGAVSRSAEAFDQIIATMGKMLDSFSARLPDLIKKATRLQPSASVTSAAVEMFRNMRSDLEADILIARHGYLQDSGKKEQAPKVATATQNAGGKPLAEHWDAMWAEIAIQLWTGDLQPKTQADIKAAMFEWLNANEIEAGDTGVTQRARALWKRWQEAQ